MKKVAKQNYLLALAQDDVLVVLVAFAEPCRLIVVCVLKQMIFVLAGGTEHTNDSRHATYSRLFIW